MHEYKPFQTPLHGRSQLLKVLFSWQRTNRWSKITRKDTEASMYVCAQPFSVSTQKTVVRITSDKKETFFFVLRNWQLPSSCFNGIWNPPNWFFYPFFPLCIRKQRLRCCFLRCTSSSDFVLAKKRLRFPRTILVIANFLELSSIHRFLWIL